MRIAMMAALMATCGTMGMGCAQGRGVLERIIGPRPIALVRKMEDPKSADNRRDGIIRLMQKDFAKREPYTKRYRQIAQNDPDFTVRAAAVRALNAARDKQAVPVFIARLGDEHQLVRWQAAKALANVPDPSAVEPLTRILGNTSEDKDVRIAAADALRHYRDASAARALIATLNARDFGVAWQARWSLRAMTGQDHRYDEKAWAESIARTG